VAAVTEPVEESLDESVGEPARVDASRVSARLRELFRGHRLSPAQRRIARFLTDRGDDVVFLTSVDIAREVGVSQPSVTRFAFALGFDGFPEFRDALRDLVRADAAQPPVNRHRNPIQALVDTEIRDLEVLADSLADLTALERVSAALAGSRPLPVLGLRVSAPLAHYLGYFAAKVLPDVRVLDQAGSVLTDQISRAADAGATWLLAIALPRYPRDLHDALTWARRCGLQVALLTDQPMGRLADQADEVLTAPVGSDFAFDSQAGPAVLCAALLHTMLESLPKEQQAALERFEQVAAERRMFLPD
jgi:DNA-binding MurR/RpiR family transcriptional regulator